MRKRSYFAAVILALTAALPLPAAAADRRIPFGGGRATQHYPRYHEYKLDNVKIVVSFDERRGSVYGDTTNTLTTIQPQTDYLDLDAAGLRYSFVGLAGGEALRRQSFGETLRVFLKGPVPAGTTLAIECKYTAQPTKGIYFVRPDAHYPDRPWEVWSQGEMIDNHWWFPTYDWPDNKATSETVTTVPEGQVVVSNGKLASVTHDRAAHTATYDWVESVPHSTYLISLVAGDFAEYVDHEGATPVTYYAPRRYKAIVAYDFRATPRMIGFFSDFIGVPYPYEKYAQSAVVDFTYGGMENISATTQTSRTLHDARSELDGNSEGLVAHELAHQWYGDLESFEDWGQEWLAEGYATYYEALYRGYAHGTDAFDMDRLGMVQGVENEDLNYRKPVVTEVYADPIEMFDAVGYSKAALVLHMLRNVVGDDAFRAAQKSFLLTYARKSANTEDWVDAMDRSTGEDLHWFADEWLYQAGFPEYKVSAVYDDAQHIERLTVDQTQSTDWNTPSVFVMPIDVAVQLPGGAIQHTTVHDDQRHQVFEIPAASQPAMVLFDDGQNVLSEVTFPKSEAELAYQMRNAPSVLDRLTAAQALVPMRSAGEAGTQNGALWFLRHERCDDARAAIIANLTMLAPEAAVRGALVGALGDSSAHVRAAAAAALEHFPATAQTLAALEARAATDRSYATIAASVTALADLHAPGMQLVLARALQERSTNGQIASAALAGYATVEGRSAIPLEMSYARYGAPADSRDAAIGALGRIGKGDAAVTAFLGHLLGDPNLRTNATVMRSLGMLGDPAAIPALARFAASTDDVRLKEPAYRTIAAIKARARAAQKGSAGSSAAGHR